MRISVVGSKGQLGTELTALLQNSGRELVALDLPDIDITSAPSIRAVLGRFKPDTIINCAAYTNVDACESDPGAAMAVNADGPHNLAAFAEEHGAWLCHVSTDYVFPGNHPVPQPYTEQDETGPASQYGITKLAGEKAIAEQTHRHTILRTSWLYGATGHNFLKAILKRALTGPETPLTVVNDQFGSPTWSMALAKQIVALLDTPPQGVVHATSEGYCSWFDFAVAFLRSMDLPNAVKPCTTAEFPRPAPRPANSILENARLKDAGMNTMVPWQNDLREFIRLHRAKLMVECGQ